MAIVYTTTTSGIHVPTSANNGTDMSLGLKQMTDEIVTASVSQWGTLYRGAEAATVAPPPGTRLLDIATGNGGFALGSATMDRCAFYLDPAALAGSPRTPELRLVVGMTVNAVPPVQNFQFILAQVTGWAGASGNPLAFTSGSAIKTLNVPTPTAGVQALAISSSATLVTAGWHYLAWDSGSPWASGSRVNFYVELQTRQTF